MKLLPLFVLIVFSNTSMVLSANKAKNPFVGRYYYVNPANQVEYDESIETADGSVKQNLALMRDTASAFWVDTYDKIEGSTTGTAEGVLADAASKYPPELVVLIWYDLPNRDCDAHTSSGEICCTYSGTGYCDFMTEASCEEGIKIYKTKYVDPFIKVIRKYDSRLPIVIVFEPGSLPNLVTSLENPKCKNEATQRAYREGSKYALQELATTDATVYLDAGHGGWLGWEDNVVAFMKLLKSLDLPWSHIRGFSTDVSGYQPLGIMCPWHPDNTYRNGWCLNGEHQEDPCCHDPCSMGSQYNPAHNELNYAQLLHYAAKGLLETNAYMLTDTARNGVPNARMDCADWCNINGAGAGLFPTADVPNPDIMDAYYWLKTPGLSDGCTKELPDGSRCARFDTLCESKDSIGHLPTQPRAPEAGNWFDYQVKQLAELAQFYPSATPNQPPPSSGGRRLSDHVLI